MTYSRCLYTSLTSSYSAALRSYAACRLTQRSSLATWDKIPANQPHTRRGAIRKITKHEFWDNTHPSIGINWKISRVCGSITQVGAARTGMEIYVFPPTSQCKVSVNHYLWALTISPLGYISPKAVHGAWVLVTVNLPFWVL